MAVVGCSKDSDVTKPSTQVSNTQVSSAKVPSTQLTTASSTQAPSHQPNALKDATAMSVVQNNDPLTQLLAVSLQNGFLLAVMQHDQLTDANKKCLVAIDSQQAVDQAKLLLSTKLSQSELTEANDFYNLPVGQKILAFNQQLYQQLKQGHTKPNPLNVTDDEKLQISAFVQTSTGQKIQQMANHDLQTAFDPIASQLLTKCQVSSDKFYATPTNASAPAIAQQKP